MEFPSTAVFVLTTSCQVLVDRTTDPLVCDLSPCILHVQATVGVVGLTLQRRRMILFCWEHRSWSVVLVEHIELIFLSCICMLRFHIAGCWWSKLYRPWAVCFVSSSSFLTLFFQLPHHSSSLSNKGLISASCEWLSNMLEFMYMYLNLPTVASGGDAGWSWDGLPHNLSFLDADCETEFIRRCCSWGSEDHHECGFQKRHHQRKL